jgi:hypothetical protein
MKRDLKNEIHAEIELWVHLCPARFKCQGDRKPERTDLQCCTVFL